MKRVHPRREIPPQSLGRLQDTSLSLPRFISGKTASDFPSACLDTRGSGPRCLHSAPPCLPSPSVGACGWESPWDGFQDAPSAPIPSGDQRLACAVVTFPPYCNSCAGADKTHQFPRIVPAVSCPQGSQSCSHPSNDLWDLPSKSFCDPQPPQ